MKMISRITAVLAAILAAAAITGCNHVKEPQPESVIELTRVSEAETGDSLIVNATIAQTKTSLGSNGLTVNWQEGDKIGILWEDAEGDPYLYSYTLYSGQGTPDGVFSGSAFTGKIVGIFYPALGSIRIASGYEDDEYYISMSLDSQQDQTPGSAVKLAPYDLKTARLPVQKNEDNTLSVIFDQKMTMLDVDLTLPSEAVGKKLENFSLTAPGAIAGDFYLNMKYSSEDPDLDGEEQSNAVSVSFNNGAGVTVPSDGKVNFKMFVLPNIAQDQSLSYTVQTSEKIYAFKVQTAKDLQSGFCYTTTLDLPALEALGKLEVIEKSAFTEITTPGVYDLNNEESPILVNDEYWQCSWSETACHFQNWNDKKALIINHPVTMVSGNTCTLEIETIGTISGFSTGAVEATVIYKDSSAGLCWLQDNNGKGYVICIN